MKKITLITLLLITSVTTFAQQFDEQENLNQHELKINMSNLIGFKWLDVGYERILNEEASVGVSTLFSLDSGSEGLDEYRTFSITPYYRHFFSKNYARGFFVEAFTMLHTGKEDVYDSYYDSSNDTYINNDYENKYTDLEVSR